MITEEYLELTGWKGYPQGSTISAEQLKKLPIGLHHYRAIILENEDGKELKDYWADSVQTVEIMLNADWIQGTCIELYRIEPLHEKYIIIK